MDGPLIIRTTYPAKLREGEGEGCISHAARGAGATHEASRFPACGAASLPVSTCRLPSARRNSPSLEGVPAKTDASGTPVLPLSVVDNSDSSPNRLTILIDSTYPSFII